MIIIIIMMIILMSFKEGDHITKDVIQCGYDKKRKL